MTPAHAEVATHNDTIVRLALKKIGRAVCPHSFALVQHRRRLFLRCPACGAETEGFAVGDRPPQKRPGMERAELLSINAAARKLGRSWEWTFAAAKAGELPGVQIAGRWYVRNLDAHLDAIQTTKPAPAAAVVGAREGESSGGSGIPVSSRWRD